AIDRQRDRLYLRDEQDVVVRRGPEREEAFGPVQELQDRLRTVVVGDALHHVDLARLGRPLRQEQIRGDGCAGKGQVGHGRIIITSARIALRPAASGNNRSARPCRSQSGRRRWFAPPRGPTARWARRPPRSWPGRGTPCIRGTAPWLARWS